SGELTGIPGVSLVVDSLSIGINQASGTNATPLDWTQSALGSPAGVAFTTGATLLVSGRAHTTGSGIFGLVSAADLQFTLSTTPETNVNVGTSTPLASGTLTQISFTATDLIAGIAGVGFETSGTVQISILTAPDGRSWTAASATLLNPQFVGVPANVFSLSAT